MPGTPLEPRSTGPHAKEILKTIVPSQLLQKLKEMGTQKSRASHSAALLGFCFEERRKVMFSPLTFDFSIQ